jgi:S-adenosylmethionine synthetase
MNIHIFPYYGRNLDKSQIEMVERKGIGHPDTLADLIAETFSNKYSYFCFKKFGVIPNHWADKVTLVGGKTKITFGKVELLQPIKIFQFGRMTPDIGKEIIDINSIFKDSVIDVFSKVFGKKNDILKFLEFQVNVHDGCGPDHPKNFYDPQSPEDIMKVHSSIRANDTVICTSYAGYSKLEKIVIELENFLNSKKFKKEFPETGYDIKILGIRLKKKITLVICIPFIANFTPTFKYYEKKKKEILEIVNKKVREFLPEFEYSIHLNTKDREKGSVYLTAFGTSLDKGGCGAVGRGNRYNGLIAPMRETPIEAYAGKNPVYHAGKLYHVAAFNISKNLFLNYSLENYINIISFNGDVIQNPSFIFVKLCKQGFGLEKNIIDTINHEISHIEEYTGKIILRDPVKDHVNRPREIYEERIK